MKHAFQLIGPSSSRALERSANASCSCADNCTWCDVIIPNGLPKPKLTQVKYLYFDRQNDELMIPYIPVLGQTKLLEYKCKLPSRWTLLFSEFEDLHKILKSLSKSSWCPIRILCERSSDCSLSCRSSSSGYHIWYSGSPAHAHLFLIIHSAASTSVSHPFNERSTCHQWRLSTL